MRLPTSANKLRTRALRPVSCALVFVACLLVNGVSLADTGTESVRALLNQSAERIHSEVVAWRHDIHQHPELANREFRTGRIVANHLRRLGLDEVREQVAHTGVVGVLKGGLPGPVVALRADMDALPVEEALDVPYASKAHAMYEGELVPVMHACGHDAHTAILMGVAEVLAAHRHLLPGQVLFIFQPAEEGPPQGEDGGASLMLKQGAFENPRPDAVFALHVANDPPGLVSYRAGGLSAASMPFDIRIQGTASDAGTPWRGHDPVHASAQIITALQSIVSRETDLTSAPSLISIGRVRTTRGTLGRMSQVELSGMIRTLLPAEAVRLRERLPDLVQDVASALGVRAQVTFRQDALPVNYTNPELLARMKPTLERDGNSRGTYISPPQFGAEDFAFFAEQVPGLYFYLGVNAEGVSAADAPPNHSASFFVNDDALVYGIRMMSALAYDYLAGEHACVEPCTMAKRPQGRGHASPAPPMPRP